jgi:hypothetical protein
MAAPDPSSNPVPMEPPTATMAIWRAVNSRFNPCSWSVIFESYNGCYNGLPERFGPHLGNQRKCMKD